MLPSVGQIYEYDFELFDWNDVVKGIDKSLQRMGDEGFRMISEGGRVPSFAIHDASCINQVNLVRHFIEKQRRIPDGFQLNCHLYASMSYESDVFGFHTDVDDVYIWQVRGTTNWQVEDALEDCTLLPNQMIYIPQGYKHRPILKGPRISVSFSVGQ